MEVRRTLRRLVSTQPYDKEDHRSIPMPFPGACIRPMVILSKTKHCQTHEPQRHRAMQPCAIRTIFRCVEEKRMMGAGIATGGKVIRGLPCTV